MIIPAAKEREEFYADITQKCLVTREERKGDYQTWRSWYLFGNGPEDAPAHFNKIYSHLNQILSFIFSAETTRFSIMLGASAARTEIAKAMKLTERLNDEWHDSEADKIFNLALEWALAYASTFIKLIPRGNDICPYVVTPDNFGVLEEGLPSGSKQEAFVHCYTITKSNLARRLYSHPNREKILERINATEKPANEIPEGVDRIILSQTSPTMLGTVNLDLWGVNRMKAKVSEETVELQELYVWNDEANDYQVVTMADPQVCVFDRLQGGDDKSPAAMFLKGESPFIQVCPNPMPDYYWGNSEVQRLLNLQQMRNNRLDEIIELLKLQVDPPTVFSGFDGIIDEKKFSIRRPGSQMSSQMPNAKAERLAPDLPDDLFREVAEIDRMFSEASGIENVIAGRGEQGVRSAGHAAQLARLGSSRAKKRALIIEDNLESLATLFVKTMKQYDKTHLETAEGLRFIAEQFTEDFSVKVDAHSNSPIFMEDSRQLAFAMYKGGVIDKEMLVRLLQPPMQQEIIEKIKKLPPQQQMAPPPHPAKKGGEGGPQLQAIEGGR